jgi:hypothetical protein
MTRRSANRTVIEGLLVPVRWGSTGEISEVGLMTFDEAEYRIDLAMVDAHGLRDCLRKHVRIFGRARGRRVVEVTSVEVLEKGVPTSSTQTSGSEEP